jgi:hypothetical protein
VIQDDLFGESGKSQTAIWQHDYRERKRELGYTKIELYVPDEYKSTIKKLVKRIMPLPHTRRGNTLHLLSTLIDLCLRGSAVVVTKKIDGWQIRDFGNVPIDDIYCKKHK